MSDLQEWSMTVNRRVTDDSCSCRSFTQAAQSTATKILLRLLITIREGDKTVEYAHVSGR